MTSPYSHTLWILAAATLTPCSTGYGQDTDIDGIPDAVESTLLSTLSPVVYPGEAQQWGDFGHPPLPVDWTIRHCYLIWYSNEDDLTYLGDTGIGNDFLTTDIALAIIQQHLADGHNYHYAIGYHDTAEHNGSSDPDDPMSWSVAQSLGKGIYGRVCRAPEGGSRYLVQYYMHFGWNETDTPPGCDYGNHEGDWLGVSYSVDAADPSSPQVIDAVYHNHGRQVFVDDPSYIEFEGTHPVVYLERGTNEPWTYFGTGGVQPGAIPARTTTNKVFRFGSCQLEWETACNFGYTVVREHNSRNIRYQVSSVVNLGEASHPYPDAESRFLDAYDGWFGNTYSDDNCYFITFGDPVRPPKAPIRQSKMWNQSYRIGTTWVELGNTNLEQSGEASSPVSSVHRALMNTVPGGDIRIIAGQSAERMTIALPVTITAVGGPVTIGQ